MTRLLIYGGPNGSGKSSLRDHGRRTDGVEVVIDPDRIARSINPLSPREADRAAGQETLRLFAATLAARQTMSLETTLSGQTILRRLRLAKDAGYWVELRYVALDFVDLNIERVQARAAKGGHDIAPDVIRRRYASSFSNLPETLSIVSRAVLIDNSGAVPRAVLETVEGRIVTTAPDLPGWLRSLMPGIAGRLRSGQPPASDLAAVQRLG